VEEEETPPTEEEETPADPAEDLDPAALAKLSIGGKLTALVASRAGLIAKLTAASAQLKTIGKDLAAMTSRATAAESALADAQATLATSQARVTALETEAKDLHSAVTDELAGLGVDRKELVAADADGKGGAVEAAYEDFRSAKSPEDKAAAHRRLKDAQAKAKASKPTAGLN
jgi:cell division protein FtsB